MIKESEPIGIKDKGVMKHLVDVEIEINEEYIDPKVKILTKEKTKLVESIVHAVENISEEEYPMIPALGDHGYEFLPQRDIVRAYTEGRKVYVQTKNVTYSVKKRLVSLEEDLTSPRFVRISQSEIINIYMVKEFDISVAGTIGVKFENGEKSWVARSCVKAIKERLHI